MQKSTILNSSDSEAKCSNITLHELTQLCTSVNAVVITPIDLGHVAIIDRNIRGSEEIPMEPDRARRYNGRSASERFNSDLKDNHGGSMLRAVYLIMSYV